jgi:hypothetical protein
MLWETIRDTDPDSPVGSTKENNIILVLFVYAMGDDKGYRSRFLSRQYKGKHKQPCTVHNMQ